LNNKKLLFLVTEDWYFISHRLPLAVAAINRGYDVSLVTQVGKHGNAITAAGIHLAPVPFPRSFKRPWRDLLTLAGIYRACRNIRPDIVHHVSLKPVVYGSLLRSLGAHGGKNPAVINAFTGLGYVFTSRRLSARLIRSLLVPLLRVLLMRDNTRLVFQNADDRDTLIDLGIARSEQCTVIPGSGVDTSLYAPVPEPAGTPMVLLASRMLYDKGVEDFVRAAERVKEQGVEARFVLVGDTDTENPAGIHVDTLQQWDDEEAVEWWGRREDMPSVYAGANIVVLPSHREGFPKTLIEAAACGRAVITTDVPGCRDAIAPGESGLLVPASDPQALAAAMIELIRDPGRRARMGLAGRQRVVERYSSEVINGRFLELYRDLTVSD
jgi:glycosyltransferase involved in cell wall biosynthesis